MQVNFDDYKDVLGAAKERQLAPETLRRALREGRVEGRKIGHQWWVPRLLTVQDQAAGECHEARPLL